MGSDYLFESCSAFCVEWRRKSHEYVHRVYCGLQKKESSYLKNSYSLFSSLCCLWITFSIMALSSGVRCDKSGLLGPTWTPVVDPVELPGPKPELVEAANPESDMPPPELPILLPRALSVAARLLVGTIRRRNKKYYNAFIGRQVSHYIQKVFLFSF